MKDHITQALLWWTAKERERHDQEIVPPRHARVLMRAGFITENEDHGWWDLTRKGKRAADRLTRKARA